MNARYFTERKDEKLMKINIHQHYNMKMPIKVNKYTKLMLFIHKIVLSWSETARKRNGKNIYHKRLKWSERAKRQVWSLCETCATTIFIDCLCTEKRKKSEIEGCFDSKNQFHVLFIFLLCKFFYRGFMIHSIENWKISLNVIVKKKKSAAEKIFRWSLKNPA